MDRFKFRAPSTSTSTSRSSLVVPRPSPDIDDDLWNDDIDEQTLLQASQLVETTAVPGCLEVDPTILSAMMTKTNEADEKATKNVRKENGDTNIVQTQTIFGDAFERRRKQSGRSSFQNSFDDETGSRPTTSLLKAAPQRIVASSSGNSVESQVEKLQAENQRLTQLHHSKTGEVAFLRAELLKRQTMFDKEKQTILKTVEAKENLLKSIEKLKNKEIETLKSERDFVKRELELAIESVAKSERSNNAQQMMSQQNQKRVSREMSPRNAKKPRLAANIDESFFEENVKPLKPPCKHSSVQTEMKKTRKYALSVKKEQDDIISDLVRLSGSLSLVTHDGSGVSPTDLNSKDAEGLAKTLSFLCKTAAGCLGNVESPPYTDEDETVSRQIVANLIAARITFSQIKGSRSVIDVPSLSEVLKITADKRFSRKSIITDAVTSLACQVLDSGHLSEPEARDFLTILVATLLDVVAKKDDPESVDRQLAMTSSALRILTTASEHYISLFCYIHKDTCILQHIWCVVERLTTLRLETTCRRSNAINFDSFIHLCQSYISFFSSSFVDRACSSAKRRSCLYDGLKSLAALLWCLVSEAERCEVKGTTPVPENLLSALKSTILCLHFSFSSDPDSFGKALAEDPVVKRLYIWTSRQLNNVKSILSLGNNIDEVLLNLSVDLEDDK